MDTSATAAQRREKAIWQGAAASVLAKGISAGCGLVQVSVAVKYLGPELFGLWMTLAGTLSFMNFADLGIGAGVQNEAAEGLGLNQVDRARFAMVNGLALLGLVGAAVASILLLAWTLWPLEEIFGLTSTVETGDVRRALFVLILLFSLSLPATCLARLAYGLQLSWLANLWMAAANVVTLVVVLLACRSGFGFVGLVTLTAIPPVLSNACLGLHVFKHMGWTWRDLPAPSSVPMSRLFRAGLPFTLPQAGALAFTAVPPILISQLLGPAMVTPYHLAQRLLALFSVPQQIILNQLWPAYTEAFARGDSKWLRRTYARSVRLSGIAVALPQVAFFLWGGWAVRWWSHGVVAMTAVAALAFGLQNALSTMGQPPAFLLNSLGRMKGQATYGVVAVVATLLALPWALRIGGIVGAPVAAAIVWAALYLPLIYREAGVHARLDRQAPPPSTLSESENKAAGH